MKEILEVYAYGYCIMSLTLFLLWILFLKMNIRLLVRMIQMKEGKEPLDWLFMLAMTYPAWGAFPALLWVVL